MRVKPQERPLTGFLSWVGLASGVREGIQKLGRLWLELATEPALEDSAELLSVLAFSLPLLCAEWGKTVVLYTFHRLNTANAFSNYDWKAEKFKS